MKDSLYKSIWFCHRYIPGESGFVEGAPTFANPVERRLAFKPISSEMLLTTAGKVSKRYLKARQNVYDADLYNEGDRLYVYVAPDSPFDPVTPDCDFEVRSSSSGYRYREVLLEGLVDYGN